MFFDVVKVNDLLSFCNYHKLNVQIFWFVLVYIYLVYRFVMIEKDSKEWEIL